MRVDPYLSFEGRCDEALDFYKKAVGAEVTMLMRGKDAPDQSMVAPGSENKVLHASLKIGDSEIGASDGNNSGKASFSGITLMITAKDDAEATRVFAALSDGGQVQMPITKTFFSSSFGMLSDKFGVGWMVMTPAP